MSTLFCSLIKNRAWMLEDFLGYIKNLEGEFDYLFYDHSSTDNSLEILWKEMPDATVYTVPSNTNVSSSRGINRHKIYRELADLRNRALDFAEDHGYDELLMIDSDVLFKPTLYKHLVSQDKLMCSTILVNDTYQFGNFTTDPRGRWCNYFGDGSGKSFGEKLSRPKYIEDSLLQCDVTGAAMLIRGRALSHRYGFHPNGEDVYYCKELFDAGIPIYCHTKVEALHVMDIRWLASAKEAMCTI